MAHLGKKLNNHIATPPFHARSTNQPNVTPRKGRPNLRWFDDLEENLVLRSVRWRALARRRLAWKKILEKAKAHPGMSSH
ncbi:hypothetical protein TNCV_2346051 [Trichonephila clavipes]|nr:hypothetical protein TNCV_2346051 [Trichonephila clavipes]